MERPVDKASYENLKLALMEVPFTNATEAQIKQFAASKGKDAAQLVEETMTRVLERRT